MKCVTCHYNKTIKNNLLENKQTRLGYICQWVPYVYGT